MLDSVRVRLTLWYTAVVAVVLILLAVLTYFLYARNIAQRTDSNLVELADSFATTFHAELSGEVGPDHPQQAAREAMVEHRFRDVVFVFQDSQGNPLLSSLDLPSAVQPNEQLTPGPVCFARLPDNRLPGWFGTSLSHHPWRKGRLSRLCSSTLGSGSHLHSRCAAVAAPSARVAEGHSQFLPGDHSHRASACSSWRLFPRPQKPRSRGPDGLQSAHHRRRESPRSSWRIESTRRTRTARHLLQ